MAECKYCQHFDFVGDCYGACQVYEMYVDLDNHCGSFKPKEKIKMNEPSVDKLVESVGSLAELSGLFYKQFQTNGFDKEQALEMTKYMMSSIIGKII